MAKLLPAPPWSPSWSLRRIPLSWAPSLWLTHSSRGSATKGAFTNYVDQILPILDPLPTPWLKFVKEFLYCYKGKSAHRWYFQDHLPRTSSCQRSLWTPPTQSVLRNGITIFGCLPKILRENNICDLFCRIVRRWQRQRGSGAPNLKPKIHTCFGPMGPSMNRKMLSSKIIFQFETKV